MNTKGTAALQFINEAFGKGLTIYLSTALRTIKVTPKTAANWELTGRPVFRLNASGDLLIASGANYLRVTSGEVVLLKITAQ